MSIFEPQGEKTPLELQTEMTRTALENYKFEKFDRHVQTETLEELLYDLFENIWFSDKVFHYQQNTVTLLSLLLKPEVVNIIRRELSPIVQDDIAQMLLKLYDFFRVMAEEYHLLQLKKVEISFCQDMEKLKHIEAKYKAKLEGCLAEQQAFKDKTVNGHCLKIVDNE